MEIHRCRFVPYPPSTINALAFSHSLISKGSKTAPPRLAVGKANGDIEIWNPLNGTWLQETVIRGGKDRSIDELIWIQDPNEEDVEGRTLIGRSRLFSIGYTTTITEWDLETGRPLNQVSGNHGEIWCLAAQPPVQAAHSSANGPDSPHQGQHLIAGCTDGALVLYSTDGGDLQLLKVLARPSAKKAKIISIIFQDRNVVVAGCTDSHIRIFDIRNGSTIRTLSVNTGPKGGPKETIVWCLKALPNGNIVSGDSTGEVKIWDGKTYTLLQRLKSHRSDCLSLATSSDGSVIFSGGMDRRTVVYKRIGKNGSRWGEVGHRRYHTHDVKTMASFESNTMSVVVSGGPDASPIVLPLKQQGMEHQRALPFLPHDPPIQTVASKRLLMSWWDREVHIWSIKKSRRAVNLEIFTPETPQPNYKLVSTVLIKGEANITCATLCPSGNLLAISTTADIKLFHVRILSQDNVKISRFTLQPTFRFSAKFLQFSPDGKWLCFIGSDNSVSLARVIDGEVESGSSITLLPQLSKLHRVDRQVDKLALLGGLGSYDRTITRIAFSSDSRILVTSDLAGYVDSWILSGHEDLSRDVSSHPREDSGSGGMDSDSEDEEEFKSEIIFGQQWIRNPAAALIPKLPCTPVVLSFRPAITSSSSVSTNEEPIVHATRHNPNPVANELPMGEDRLLVIGASGDVYEFEALKGSLTAWSRRNPTSSFPESYSRIRDHAKGCFWDVSDSRERLWLFGTGWLWMFDLSRDMVETPRDQSSGGSNNIVAGKKRKLGRHGKEVSTGAGSAIPDDMLEVGISRKTRRYIEDEVDEELDHWDSLNRMVDGDEDDDDDMTDAIPFRLARPDKEAENIGTDMVIDEPSEATTPTRDALPYWKTFKYRPILGMAIIGKRSGKDDDLEVAIVERPIWEADLPDRYYGDQEWERGSI